MTELTPGENKTTKLYWSFMDDHGDQWMRVVLQLPNITQRFVTVTHTKLVTGKPCKRNQKSTAVLSDPEFIKWISYINLDSVYYLV